MQSIKNWLLAFRPKTLTACLVPILVSTALVKALHLSVDSGVIAFTLLASFFIQIGTNLVNDAVDFKKGADTE
ncbi:MAG: 1,4-dihydroxy-2-naphthoate octaprenyltransferase, partial [Proteobacteria bacterium]